MYIENQFSFPRDKRFTYNFFFIESCNNLVSLYCSDNLFHQKSSEFLIS